MTSKLPAIFGRTVAEMEKMLGDFNQTVIDSDRFFTRFDKTFPLSIRSVSYPPVDVVKLEDGYRITLAVAGYAKDDLSVELSGDVLTVTGDINKETDAQYLFKGISSRHFIRKWQLIEGDTIGDITLKNGLLNIKINRQPPTEPTVKKLNILSDE